MFIRMMEMVESFDVSVLTCTYLLYTVTDPLSITASTWIEDRDDDTWKTTGVSPASGQRLTAIFHAAMNSVSYSTSCFSMVGGNT